MGRLIELDSPDACPERLTLRPGDLLLARATGGRVHGAAGVLEAIGALRTAVIGTDGAVIAPEGPPDAFLCRAIGEGDRRLDLVFGDPFGLTHTTSVRVMVTA